MKKQTVEILVNYTENQTNEQRQSFIEDADYLTALRKFLKIKGGREKITITSIQDWDRREKRFTIDSPITLEDTASVIYQVMNEGTI